MTNHNFSFSEGNASDSLSAHNGFAFSTVDRNNDQAPKCCPCAPAYGGGWWFYRSSDNYEENKRLNKCCFSCFEANLNGEYFIDPKDNGYYRGIIWELWLGDYSLMVNMRHYALIMIKNKFPGD